MAWVTPRTWTVGQLVSAAELNEQIRDNLNHLKVAVDVNGKIVALSATYVADLSGTALTGVMKTGGDNAFTSGVQDFSAGASTRVVLPIGADKWATV
jgi:hypothetical protein